MTSDAQIRQLVEKWRKREQALARRADGQGQTFYAEILGAQAQECGDRTDELAALLSSPGAAEPEPDVIGDIVAHWFTQGGEMQFGAIGTPQNADELVAAILARVRAERPPAPGDTLAWLNAEQRSATRWSRGDRGIYRFSLTGPELMRIRQELGARSREWQCRFVADDQQCCQLPVGHDGDHQMPAPLTPPEGPEAEAR